MNIKLKIISSVLWVGVFVQTGFAQNLDDYKIEAAQNNPQLRAVYFEYLSALEQVPQVGALPDPELSFAWFVRPVETRLGPQQARISVTQMLPWFGTRKQNVSGRLLAAKAKFEHFRETRNQLFYQMEVLWAELFEATEKIRLAKENLEIVNTLVNVSLRKYETGLVPQVDVLRAQIEQEDLKTNIALLEDDLEIVMSAFNKLRNAPLHSEVTVPKALQESNGISSREKEIREQVISNNPDIHRLRLLEQKAEVDVENASNQNKPSFGVGLDYIATGERTDVPTLADNGRDAVIARLNIKVPLFRAKNRAKTQEATYALSASRDRISDRTNQLEQAVIAEIRALRDAQRRYELYDEQQIYRVQQAVNIMLQSYATDNSDFEEILRLQRKLFEYELERIKAKTDQFKVVARLDYLSGSNNVSMQDINY
ncbi:MAG: TolC family protein [Balneolaceae bacterium]|nr:TolC family protein [Balneolaceae bacterium]